MWDIVNANASLAVGRRPNITRQAGYLVDRSKTPFAWAYIDDYEVVR